MSGRLTMALVLLLFNVTDIPTIGIEYSHIGGSRIVGIASSSGGNSSRQDAFNYRPSS